jgi:hypothetical protein
MEVRMSFASNRSRLVLALALVWQAGSHSARAQSWKAEGTYQLPRVGISEFLAEHLGLNVDDHDIDLGGIGSDLWRGKADGPGISG